jgi:GR25 family glycosyltransferase involved in LPS biosynthesis
MGAPQIEIITLMKNEERLKNAKSLNAKNVNIFEAVDKDDNEKLSKLVDRFNVKFKEVNMHMRGSQACLISHILVIEKFLSSPHKYLIVLEDDFKIVKDLPTSDVNIEAMFAEINQKPENVDILYINNRYKYDDNYRIIEGVGTEGYILTKHGAKKIYEIILKNGADLYIDHLLCKYCKIEEDSSEWSPGRAGGDKDNVINCFRSKDHYVDHLGEHGHHDGFGSVRLCHDNNQPV